MKTKPKAQLDHAAAAAAFGRWGWDTAKQLGFSYEQFRMLWWLSLWPKWTAEVWDEGKRRRLLLLIGQKPKEASSVISAIHKCRDRHSLIRNVLLACGEPPPNQTEWTTTEPQNWKLTDKEVAFLVAKKLGQTFKDERLFRLIDSVKKVRQELTRQFPAKKGKK